MRKYLYLFLFFYALVTGFYYALGWLQLPEGYSYVYPIDDVYIHQALSRNFAELGVWSVNKTGFDSASSSIFYTLLLSFFYKFFGESNYYPMLINIIFGFATVYMIWRYFKTYYGEKELRWALFLFLPFTLLYAMVIFGMEHTIHMFLMVCAIYWMRKNERSDYIGTDFYKLLIFVFLIGGIRYESMFFTVSLFFVLILKKKFFESFTTLFIGFLPILIFGLISVQNNGFFFPNSVMIKGNYFSENQIILQFWMLLKKGIFLNLSFYKYLFFPLVIIYFSILEKQHSLQQMLKSKTPEIVILITTILQALFAMVEYRYENYLMVSFLLLIVPVISAYSIQKTYFKRVKEVFLGMAIIGILFISFYRFYYFHNPLKFAPKSVMEQQIEMSRFLHQYYKGEKIVANDIGAISYFGNVQLLDIVGLGSTDIARKVVHYKNKPKMEFDNEMHTFLKNYANANNYKIAVIYPEWFPKEIPKEWTAVASWTNVKNKYTARNRVVFYAIKQSEIENLKNRLKNFNTNPNILQEFLLQ